jgi:ATP-dependent exoDNAse (exonuclease V) beta subunit
MSQAHADDLTRHRIGSALDETLFVEAGAGSGKTRALVDRVLALVLDGAEPIGHVAAITFTEKAAAELRDRIRLGLEAAADRASTAPDPERLARCERALDDLDAAAIGTLHSFARRILTEHPVEAGLPPRIDVLDEVASTVAFDDRWASCLDDLLGDPDLARPILLLTAAGVRLTALREIALSFNQSWDLVADRAPTSAAPLPDWEPRLAGLLDGFDAVLAERGRCREGDDHLLRLLDQVGEWVSLVQAAPDESARLGLLKVDGGRPKASPNGKGNKRNWESDCDLPAMRSRLRELLDDCEDLANEVALAALTRVAVALRGFTLAAAAERRRDGQLEFHDLLVMARQMLRDPDHGPTVRAALRDRYRRLLIDEFQDTDPIQVELALLVASPDPDAGAQPWEAIEPEPGRLFFVGDPKQSIYRFRRADIGVFLAAQARFAPPGSPAALSLRTNHRSGESLVAWTNRTFGALIAPDDDVPPATGPDRPAAPPPEASKRTQPPFTPSIAVRGDAPMGPPVTVVGREAHDDKPGADELREREAVEVAATVRRALVDGWTVDRSRDWEQPDWQPARAGDVTILVPTRLSLPFLEDALDDVGIAYRVESASLVYASRLVRDLFLTLRSIDDPTDELCTVAALRSALFGCGDDDLARYRDLGGRFDHSAPRPPQPPTPDESGAQPPPDVRDGGVPDDDPVAQGLDYLRRMHRRRRWLTPSEMVDQVVRDRRVMELADGSGRTRDQWQRLRFVVDQARAWTDATHGSLRQYLDWVRHQSAPGSRVAEAVLPETDDDAVRIMTVHAAKGLQFPVTIVAGLSTMPNGGWASAQVVWPAEGPCILNVGRKVTSRAYQEWRPLDEQMSYDERVRLLYVACTRARDHLVVSLHRRARVRPVTSLARATNAEVLVEALGDELASLPDGVVDDGPAFDQLAMALPTHHEPPPPPPFAEWEAERTAALSAASRPRSVAATALTDEGRPDAEADPGLHKRPGDLDLPPWRRGRYGTAVGRAVHGVLQLVDLTSGEGVDEAVAAQAAAEGVVGSEDHLRSLVQAALDSPAVREASRSPHWRELYVAVPTGDGRTLEGYVDLLYRRHDGLVVVDYKTGPENPDDDVSAALAGYRLQGASYALAVADATGEPVVDVVFVFVTPHGPAEHHIGDLDAAVAEARAALATDAFTVADTALPALPGTTLRSWGATSSGRT